MVRKIVCLENKWKFFKIGLLIFSIDVMLRKLFVDNFLRWYILSSDVLGSVIL